MKYRAIVFDWDGTLHDCIGYIVACFQTAANDKHVPVPTAEAIKSMIPLLGDDLMGPFYQQYYERLNAPPLFLGVKDVLEQLVKRGFLLGIATTRFKTDLINSLNRTKLSAYFSAIRCEDKTPPKPNPQMLLEIINELGVKPQETLMIGDGQNDILMAKNAGVDALAVTYGVGKMANLALHSPIGYLSDIQQLPEWLDQQSNL